MSLLRIAIIVATVGVVGRADTIRVPADQPTLQAAIDVANPGDAIVLSGGSHGTATVLAKSLTIQSEPNETATVGLTISNVVAPGVLLSRLAGSVILDHSVGTLDRFSRLGLRADSSEVSVLGGRTRGSSLWFTESDVTIDALLATGLGTGIIATDTQIGIYNSVIDYVDGNGPCDGPSSIYLSRCVVDFVNVTIPDCMSCSETTGVLANCLVYGGCIGTTQIACDSPAHSNPSSLDVPTLYHLAADSPAVDASDATYSRRDAFDVDGDADFDEPYPFDVFGNPRSIDVAHAANVRGSILDVGAQERSDSADIVYASALHLSEGACYNFEVSVFGPEAEVVDIIAEIDGVTVSGAPLVFSTSGQTLTASICAAQDQNIRTETGSVSIAARNWSDAIPATVSDDDVPSVIADVTYIDANGLWIDLRLSGTPYGPAVVSAFGDEDIATVAPEIVVFDGNNYGANQAVSVSWTPNCEYDAITLVFALSQDGVPFGSTAVQAAEARPTISPAHFSFPVNEGAAQTIQVSFSRRLLCPSELRLSELDGNGHTNFAPPIFAVLPSNPIVIEPNESLGPVSLTIQALEEPNCDFKGAFSSLWFTSGGQTFSLGTIQVQRIDNDGPSGACFGDLDGDSDVDLGDLAGLLADFGVGEVADLNCRGGTNLADLAGLLARFGEACP